MQPEVAAIPDEFERKDQHCQAARDAIEAPARAGNQLERGVREQYGAQDREDQNA